MSVICPHVCPCSLLPVPSGFSQAQLDSFQSFTGMKSLKKTRSFDQERSLARKEKGKHKHWQLRRKPRRKQVHYERTDVSMSACKAKTFPAALSSSKQSALTMKIMFCFHLWFSPCGSSLCFFNCKKLFCRRRQLYWPLCLCMHMYVYPPPSALGLLLIHSQFSLPLLYLCLNLNCPCQLLLMERSLHYFSFIKKE